MVYEFASTSKITFAGSGFSAMATSEANIAYFSKLFASQMISHDKVNQLRHVRYLKNKAHTIVMIARKSDFVLIVILTIFRSFANIIKRSIGSMGKFKNLYKAAGFN